MLVPQSLGPIIRDWYATRKAAKYEETGGRCESCFGVFDPEEMVWSRGKLYCRPCEVRTDPDADEPLH